MTTEETGRVDARAQVAEHIRLERTRQDAQWGGEDNDNKQTRNDWVAYIVKQLGAMVSVTDPSEIYYRLIKVAALASAGAECIARAQKRGYLEIKSR